MKLAAENVAQNEIVIDFNHFSNSLALKNLMGLVILSTTGEKLFSMKRAAER
jgi:hypothetical protein